jgi:hypothetical protein
MKTRLSILVLASALAADVFAGGQQIAVEVAKGGDSLLVRTYHCGTPGDIKLVGTAEGVVNGQPRRVELKLAATGEPGVYSVARQWPAEGAWVLAFTNAGGAFVNALVELRQGARLEIASQESTIRKLSRPQLDAALQRVARR